VIDPRSSPVFYFGSKHKKTEMLHKPVVNSIDLKDLTTETCFLKADTTLLLKSYGLGGRDSVRLISRVFNALGRRKFAAVRKQSRYFLGCAHARYPIPDEHSTAPAFISRSCDFA